MEGVVMSPVLKLLLDAAAHLEAQIGRNRHIASIKQAVDIASKEETIARLVAPALAIGPDMSGFERREGALLCDRTTALVDVSYYNSKCTLAKTWVDEVRLAIARPLAL
jgi:hypothetical protein